MTKYSTCFRTLLTLSIVLAAVSASQAGLFGRWRTRYDAPACPPVAVSTPQSNIPAAGPTVYSVAKPVIDENAEGATVSVPANGSYVPATGVSTSTGWSTMPRSSVDFGKFPPYSN